MAQYALRLHTGELIVDESWTSYDKLMKGMHGWCDTQTSELGTPLVQVDGVWKEVHENFGRETSGST